MVCKQNKENKLILIPKTERYIEYILELIIRLRYLKISKV